MQISPIMELATLAETISKALPEDLRKQYKLGEMARALLGMEEVQSQLVTLLRGTNMFLQQICHAQGLNPDAVILTVGNNKVQLSRFLTDVNKMLEQFKVVVQVHDA